MYPGETLDPAVEQHLRLEAFEVNQLSYIYIFRPHVAYRGNLMLKTLSELSLRKSLLILKLMPDVGPHIICRTCVVKLNVYSI